MNSAVACDMAWSARAFQTIVWPAISALCGGGQIQQVEGEEGKTLDMYAGIDAWQIMAENRAMRGIASRVQSDTGRRGYPYDTFSIRMTRPTCQTEYEKRVEAITSDRGMIYPHLTVQAYLDETRLHLMSVAVVRTRDLYEFVQTRGLEAFRRIENTDGSSSFIAVSWGLLTSHSVAVKIRRANAPYMPAGTRSHGGR